MQVAKLTIVVSFLFLIFGCQPKAENEKKPNIILLLVDDMGWSDLGCYAQDDFHETPQIDKLASEGIRFTNAYATCAVCSPTRASIMTGKYPARIKITDWIPGHSTGNKNYITPKYRYEMPLEEVTLAEALKPAGYETFHVGKWHLGEHEQFWPLSHGFDVNVGGHAKGAPGSYYFPYAKLDKRPSYDMDWTNLNLSTGHKEGDYLTDKLTDHAIELIEGAVQNDKPFFLHMAYYQVHVPDEGKLKYVEKYKAKFESGSYPKKNFHYAAMVQSLDESVGRILSKLEELNIEEETFIILTSDNGGLAGGRFNGNAPLRAGKGAHYEGGIREPFIIRWPGKVKAAEESAQIVTSTDIYPTILELAGVVIPEGQGMDGKSLTSLFQNPASLLNRDEIFWHYPHYHSGKPVSVIRSGDYKLMQFLEDEHLELYNLKEDIGEKDNLAETIPEKANALLQKLNIWKQEVDAAKFRKRTPENEKYARSGSGWIGSNNIKNPPVFEQVENDKLRIYTFNEADIRYTIDGSEPNKLSPVYSEPIDISKGGVIKAKSFSTGGFESDVEKIIFPVLNVTVVQASSETAEHKATFACDMQPETYWESDGNSSSNEIVFDLGEERNVSGFIYQAARRKKYGVIEIGSLKNNVDGAIKSYELEISLDGKNWELAKSGDFEYIRYAFLNENTVWFDEAKKCRFAKLKANSSIDGGQSVNIENFQFIPQ